MAGHLFSSTAKPSANSKSKDAAIYAHSPASPSPPWAVAASFRNSSTPRHGLAVSDAHVFAAQEHKAHVHVYSRLRGNHEAVVPFHERIRCLALAQTGQVLVLGTAEGRLILWETCTGRQAATPPCHVQPISCLAVGPYHVLSASDDSNINVWSLARLLELGADVGQEPDLTLSNHRAAITDLALGPTSHAETSLCVSASSDKTCILWNYQTGQLLRTLLFPAAPLCVSLDPCARAIFVSASDGGLYLVELFGETPLLGSRTAELASIVVQVGAPLGVADAHVGPASCLATGYDGTFVVTGHADGSILRWSLADHGHPAQVASLDASITNLVFAASMPEQRLCRITHVVKPNQTRQYTVTAQLERDLTATNTFLERLNSPGIDALGLEKALLSLSAHSSRDRHDS